MSETAIMQLREALEYTRGQATKQEEAMLLAQAEGTTEGRDKCAMIMEEWLNTLDEIDELAALLAELLR